jgi:hypothetical protein
MCLVMAPGLSAANLPRNRDIEGETDQNRYGYTAGVSPDASYISTMCAYEVRNDQR